MTSLQRITARLLFATGLGAALVSPACADVVINGVTLQPETATALAAQIGAVPRDGRYWYDAGSGAFGLEGGATAGFLPANLSLGRLAPHASGGGDGRYGGVFVNGRELHPLDIVGLQRLLGAVVPGRYWVDGWGNFGYEGGPPLGNLRALATARGGGGGGRPRGSRPSGCYGGSACDTQHTWLGDNYFSDGKTGCIVMEGEISC